jgi:hypothetical protein
MQWGERGPLRTGPTLGKSLVTGNVFGGMFNPAHHRRVLPGIALTFS